MGHQPCFEKREQLLILRIWLGNKAEAGQTDEEAQGYLDIKNKSFKLIL